MDEAKNYKSLKILPKESLDIDTIFSSPNKMDMGIYDNTDINTHNDEIFAVIEIDSDISSDTPSFTIPKRIEPIIDEQRKVFNKMRDLGRSNRFSNINSSKFYNKQVQYENSKIFYKQAVFMKDFEDNYTESMPFSQYFPYYQMMGYEQLRTYFTWRTKVRKNIIENTSLSYAFIYIYELINNIGVNNPVEGLDRLMTFWSAYKMYDETIDKYMLRWIKDYHVYYELPVSFKDFLIQHKLQEYYPDILIYESVKNYNFVTLSKISKYNIKQSAFYDNEMSELIKDCFDFLINQLQMIFSNAGINLNDFLFYPAKSKSIWSPFQRALFYPALNQQDRCVMFSDNEIYTCNQNKWLLSTIITLESGKQLIGYIMKQMEVELRRLTKYKYKLTANIDTLSDDIITKLHTAGISLEKEINNAVLNFYREKNKTVVSVDLSSLHKIRSDALNTQEKLIIYENDIEILQPLCYNTPIEALNQNEEAVTLKPSIQDGWLNLKESLSDIEIKTLIAVLNDEKDIKQFADKHGIMLEVLADNINEKSVDCIGDSILELNDSMIIYDEYKEIILKMVE